MAMGGTPAGGYGAGHFVFGVDANSCFVGVYSPLAYNDGNWHQAVGTWAGATGTALASSQFQLYVDGVVASTPGSASTAGCATTPQSSDPAGYRIGIHPIWGGFYTGSLDDIRVWDRALSASEALAAYQSYR